MIVGEQTCRDAPDCPLYSRLQLLSQTCVAYSNNGNVWPGGSPQIDAAMATLEERMNKKLGDAEDLTACLRPFWCTILHAWHDGHCS